MGTMIHSLLWVMQDFDHPPYPYYSHYTQKLLGSRPPASSAPSPISWKKAGAGFGGLGTRACGLGV